MKHWDKEQLFNNLIWFHTTSNRFCLNILSNGIIADINKEIELDFGYGFYQNVAESTDSLNQSWDVTSENN